MLKNIPKILSPELLKALCEMGHSDRLIISDGNFVAIIKKTMTEYPGELPSLNSRKCAKISEWI